MRSLFRSSKVIVVVFYWSPQELSKHTERSLILFVKSMWSIDLFYTIRESWSYILFTNIDHLFYLNAGWEVITNSIGLNRFQNKYMRTIDFSWERRSAYERDVFYLFAKIDRTFYSQTLIIYCSYELCPFIRFKWTLIISSILLD